MLNSETWAGKRKKEEEEEEVYSSGITLFAIGSFCLSTRTCINVYQSVWSCAVIDESLRSRSWNAEEDNKKNYHVIWKK
jgi:hypothetical protein